VDSLEEMLSFLHMSILKKIFFVFAIIFGGFLFVFGGYDDSPGAQLLGLIIVAVTIFLAIKNRKKD